ncbi:Anthrax toxin receptor 1 [Balamuthia mandrillaris]
MLVLMMIHRRLPMAVLLMRLLWGAAVFVLLVEYGSLGRPISTSCASCSYERAHVFPPLNSVGVTVGDANGDRYPDVMVFVAGQSPYLWINNLEGGFETTPIRPINGTALRALVRDFNNDGYPDIFSNFRSTMHFGGPGFTFPSENSLRLEAAPPTTKVGHLVTYDFDGNGFLDILATELTNAPSFILLNKNGRDFEMGAQLNAAPAGCETRHASLGDLNGDGVVDILFSLRPKTAVDAGLALPTIFYGRKNPLRFEEGPKLDVPGEHWGSALLDYDKDGDLDIAIASRGTAMCTLWTNQGCGNFTRTDVGKFKAWSVEAQDMNGDQWPDLIWGSDRYVKKYMYFNQKGSFSEAHRFAFEHEADVTETLKHGRAIGIGDFNVDGSLDIFWASHGGTNDPLAVNELWLSLCEGCSQTVGESFNVDEDMVAFAAVVPQKVQPCKQFESSSSASSASASASSSSSAASSSSSSSIGDTSGSSSGSDNDDPEVSVVFSSQPDFTYESWMLTNQEKNDTGRDGAAESSSFLDFSGSTQDDGVVALDFKFVELIEVTSSGEPAVPEQKIKMPESGYSFFTYKCHNLTCIGFMLKQVPVGQSKVDLFWEYILSKGTADIPYGARKQELDPNSVRWSISVEGWPFLNCDNRLRVVTTLESHEGLLTLGQEGEKIDETKYSTTRKLQDGRASFILRSSNEAIVGEGQLVAAITRWNAAEQSLFFDLPAGCPSSSSSSSLASSSSSTENEGESPPITSLKIVYDPSIRVALGEDSGSNSKNDDGDENNLGDLFGSGETTIAIIACVAAAVGVISIITVTGVITLFKRRRRQQTLHQKLASPFL